MLLVVGAGLVVGGAGAWRAGAWCVAAGVLLAGVLRLLLPARRAGLLAVRSRRLDVALLLLLGLVLAVLAGTVPAA